MMRSTSDPLSPRLLYILDPSPHGQNPVQSTIDDQSTGLYTSARPIELSPEQGTLYRSLVKR